MEFFLTVTQAGVARRECECLITNNSQFGSDEWLMNYNTIP